MKSKSPNSAREIAVRLLARREHSAAELSAKLSQKGVLDQDIADTLDWLQQHDLQSDFRFCESFSRYRIKMGYGQYWIEHALRQKGIAVDMISAMLPSDSEFWRENMLATWQKKFMQHATTDRELAKQKRFLIARGFSPQAVSQFLLSCKT